VKAWRPSAFLLLSGALHVLAVAVWVIWPAYWRWPLLALIGNHLLIAGIGLWPRSRWLGANLLRLPASAVARGEVAITIDDGPDPEVTPQVLEILAQYGAKASFFCIGERAAACPALVQAIVAAGHQIENHGQRHRNHLSLSGPGGWRREIGEAQHTLQQLAGQPPAYYRALAGLRNPVLQALGLRLVTWTRRGFDTRCADVDVVLQRLTQGLSAGDILLLHDGHAACTPAGEPVIVAVLPRLLTLLAQRGLHAVALPREL
jgi:peptidoglycan/xylan/chitin deacetylase (PgdA/CDA1 family)